MADAIVRVVENRVTVTVFGAALLAPLLAQAAGSAAAADNSADAAALSAAAAEAVVGPTYASTAAGLAATAEGGSFAVDNGDGTVSIYREVGGNAFLQRKLATSAALAASTGSSLVGFLQTGTGGVARDVLGKLRDTVSLLDFIPANLHAAIKARTSTANVASYVQAALDAIAAAGGGELRWPAGDYCLDEEINLPRNVHIQGAGFGWTEITGPPMGTVLRVRHNGYAIKHISPLNQKNSACNTIRDLFFYCVNPNASTGAAFRDQGGSYLLLERLWIQGFKRGIVFDQTENTDIVRCVFFEQKECGIWLVNGPDLDPASEGGYTNRIGVYGCEFNQPVVGGIIDDGGIGHVYRDSNFNGCPQFDIRVAGFSNALIEGSEHEFCGGVNFKLSRYTYLAHRDQGGTSAISIRNTMITQSAGAAISVEGVPEVDGSGLAALILDNNEWRGQPGNAAAVTNCNFVGEINTRGNVTTGHLKLLDQRAFSRTNTTESASRATAIWNPPVVANGAATGSTFAVAGAKLKDRIDVSFSNPLGVGIYLAASVTATDEVTVSLFNFSGAGIDLGSGTLTFDITPDAVP